MTKTGRNDLCPCGSGRKFKKCCEARERGTRSRVMMLVVGGAVVAGVGFILIYVRSRIKARP